ncbi:hypothetical protein BHE74_00045800 [Ensete ventricosum]|nr:hypothetical protein GW17_00055140 [Ensete ventricosum]RWW48144.1 hypothetical protein BHE74_00045800 [Ensete ventricosum]RZS14448.1 hypothetical protein BHM03_00046136 [Ensete ventricosum]
MRWNLTRSSPGDSPKGSGSSLGTHREIARSRARCKNAGGCQIRWDEQWLDRSYPRNRVTTSSYRRVNRPYPGN